jgi:hypothetical protein
LVTAIAFADVVLFLVAAVTALLAARGTVGFLWWARIAKSLLALTNSTLIMLDRWFWTPEEYRWIVRTLLLASIPIAYILPDVAAIVGRRKLISRIESMATGGGDG